ncbi:hypothetical protein DFP73DRAFT_228790 [Morchella snyderi]|nr:hypothetical protein DFP73DRAFT_228790 [Morchella snyderi]
MTIRAPRALFITRSFSITEHGSSITHTPEFYVIFSILYSLGIFFCFAFYLFSVFRNFISTVVITEFLGTGLSRVVGSFGSGFYILYLISKFWTSNFFLDISLQTQMFFTFLPFAFI